MPSWRELLAAAGAGWLAGAAAPVHGASGPPAYVASATRQSTSFRDDFADGMWRDEWQLFREEHGSVEIVESPADGSNAMSLRQTQGNGTAVYVAWNRGLPGWADPWTLSGAFYTADLQAGDPSQVHHLRLFVDPDTGEFPLAVSLGFWDGERRNNGFGLSEGHDAIADSERLRPDWQSDTLYEYALSYDGAGGYRACLWAAGEYLGSVDAKGEPLADEERAAGLLVNGADDTPLEMHHLFVMWQSGDAPEGTVGGPACNPGPDGGDDTAEGGTGSGDYTPEDRVTNTAPDRGDEASLGAWLAGWSPLLALLAGVPVVGSVVLGVLVALDERLDGRDGD